jgi:hypothetical protein
MLDWLDPHLVANAIQHSLENVNSLGDARAGVGVVVNNALETLKWTDDAWVVPD